MLKTLTVWNFALLEQVEIDFSMGLNILTGETGAGKSILIDALGAILGNRLSSDAIRTGAEWLRVEAVFSVKSTNAVHGFLADEAIDDDDNTLIITRQLTVKGKSSILVNGCRVNLSVLKRLGKYLVDIHGQNENLLLLQKEEQFLLLDESDEHIKEILTKYKEAYHILQKTQEDLAQKKQEMKILEERYDLLKWQLQEIEQASLKVGEDVEMEEEIKRLSNIEKISTNIDRAYYLFAGDDNFLGILASLSEAKEKIEKVVNYDALLEDIPPMLENMHIDLQEIFYRLRDYKEEISFDPQKLDRLQSRLVLLDTLKHKYGETLLDVMDYKEKLKGEIASFENSDADIDILQKKISKEEKIVDELGTKLTQERKKVAAKLSIAIGKELLSLGMENARFRIVILEAKPSSNGKDDIEFIFSANVGEEEKDLEKVASGGELSRLSLAIKTVMAQRDNNARIMVFDEIDTGIGGKTAQLVAQKIAVIASHKQVLCITHLPAIASMADVHLYIQKHTLKGKTVTKVKKLTQGERISEISRMASGLDVSEIALDNAREMIDHATRKKELLRSLKTTKAD